MVNGGLYNWIYSVHKQTQKRVVPPCDMNSYEIIQRFGSMQLQTHGWRAESHGWLVLVEL